MLHAVQGSFLKLRTKTRLKYTFGKTKLLKIPPQSQKTVRYKRQLPQLVDSSSTVLYKEPYVLYNILQYCTLYNTYLPEERVFV